jgi:hypothetical protein
MATFRGYEVQEEIVIRKWMYEIEAPDESAAMSLIRNGEADPMDCGTIGEPFYSRSGFAVPPADADSYVGWDEALADFESNESDSDSRSQCVSSVVEAIEVALNYFEDTRHGKEWIEAGGVEAKMLREALNALRAEGTV